MIRLQRHKITRPLNIPFTIRTTLDFMAWCNRHGYVTHTGRSLMQERGTFYVDVPDEAAAVEMALIWAEHYMFDRIIMVDEKYSFL
jgi:hypothetical protein